METNPFITRFPHGITGVDKPEGIRSFMNALLATLRREHNNTQAGDTTFYWDLIKRSSNIKLYTLGSLSRFFHEDLGLLVCKYVKFTKWDSNNSIGPVGLIGDSTKFENCVTNDYAKSDPSLFVGFSCLEEPPADGDYGWVLIDGSNPVAFHSTTLPQYKSQAYVWAATGLIQPAGIGSAVGLRVAFDGDPELGVGEFIVKSCGPSDDLIRSLTEERFEVIEDVVNGHSAWISSTNLQLSNFAAFQNNQYSIDGAINSRLTAEEQTRGSQIDNLQAQINAITDITAGSGDFVVLAYFTSYAAETSARIDAANNLASSAWSLANSVSFGPINAAIDLLNSAVTATNTNLATTNANIATIIPTHVAEVDPHPQYLKVSTKTKYDRWEESLFSSANLQVGSFAGTAIVSGTIATAPNTALIDGKHFGGILLRSSASASSGYRFITQPLLAAGQLDLLFRGVIALVGSNATRQARLGFHDTATASDAVDGAYFQIDNLTVSAKTSSNSVKTTAPTTFVLTADTHYVFEVNINPAATEAEFTVSVEDTGAVVFSQLVTTNIPNGGARAFGAGLVTTSSGAAISDLVHLQTIGFGTVVGYSEFNK